MSQQHPSIKILPYVSLTVFFGLLWLPLGQQAFLLDHWMKLGVYLAPVMVFTFVCHHSGAIQWSLSDFRLMSLVMLVFYIAHQFEEHWIDLWGNSYAFHGFVNHWIASVLDNDAANFEVLTPHAIFMINTSLVWLLGFLAFLTACSYRFPALCFNSILLVNALAHVLTTVTQQVYNPGLLTAVVLFIPISLLIYRNAWKAKLATPGLIVLSLVWGIMAHIIMVAGLIGANGLKWYPEYVYSLILVIWSVIPVVFYRPAVKQSLG
ncbi:MAG: HXXEE domain-containing protein [Verrucomicrobiota bacterium]